mgnify:CR=1 FL=1
MFLDYFALGVLIFVFLVIFYGIIILHDIPYMLSGRFCGFGPRFTARSGDGECKAMIHPLCNCNSALPGWRNSSPTSNPLLPSNTYGFTDYFDLCGFCMGNV